MNGRRALFRAAGPLWLAGVIAGTVLLMRYDATPGGGGSPPRRWPAESALPRASRQPVLLLFMHPRCPCSRASLAELERLLPAGSGRMETRVICVVPARADDGWTASASWRRASDLPGVLTSLDPGGVEARRFGVETSGHALVYDAGGELLFSGGITPSRGHQGRNAGSAAVSALAAGSNPRTRRTLVFGCPLWNGEEAEGCPPGGDCCGGSPAATPP